MSDPPSYKVGPLTVRLPPGARAKLNLKPAAVAQPKIVVRIAAQKIAEGREQQRLDSLLLNADNVPAHVALRNEERHVGSLGTQANDRWATAVAGFVPPDEYAPIVPIPASPVVGPNYYLRNSYRGWQVVSDIKMVVTVHTHVGYGGANTNPPHRFANVEVDGRPTMDTMKAAFRAGMANMVRWMPKMLRFTPNTFGNGSDVHFMYIAGGFRLSGVLEPEIGRVGGWVHKAIEVHVIHSCWRLPSSIPDEYKAVIDVQGPRTFEVGANKALFGPLLFAKMLKLAFVNAPSWQSALGGRHYQRCSDKLTVSVKVSKGTELSYNSKDVNVAEPNLARIINAARELGIPLRIDPARTKLNSLREKVFKQLPDTWPDDRRWPGEAPAYHITGNPQVSEILRRPKNASHGTRTGNPRGRPRAGLAHAPRPPQIPDPMDVAAVINESGLPPGEFSSWRPSVPNAAAVAPLPLDVVDLFDDQLPEDVGAAAAAASPSPPPLPLSTSVPASLSFAGTEPEPWSLSPRASPPLGQREFRYNGTGDIDADTDVYGDDERFFSRYD